MPKMFPTFFSLSMLILCLGVFYRFNLVPNITGEVEYVEQTGSYRLMVPRDWERTSEHRYLPDGTEMAPYARSSVTFKDNRDHSLGYGSISISELKPDSTIKLPPKYVADNLGIDNPLLTTIYSKEEALRVRSVIASFTVEEKRFIVYASGDTAILRRYLRTLKSDLVGDASNEEIL